MLVLQNYLHQTSSWLADHGLSAWADKMVATGDQLQHNERFFLTIDKLATTTSVGRFELQGDSLAFGQQSPPRQQLRELLQALKPWRKGPWKIERVAIDSEWNCAIKWRRMASLLKTLLPGSRVLDVGGGNGYYAWRCLLGGAASVLLLDPNPLAWAQWQVCQHYVQDRRIAFVPARLEAMPPVAPPAFDLLLCLGVIYHSQAPFSLLRKLRRQLRPGGRLMLESLVIEGDATNVLTPRDRYAAMPNVWAIPSLAALSRWLERCGYSDITLVAPAEPTRPEEQAATSWSQPFSLLDALDPVDPSRTREGYPAPKRAMLIASTR